MQLVRRKRAYGALSNAVLASPYAKRARMAYALGSYAYRNRRAIRGTVRMFRKMRRGRKRRRANFSRRNIGEPVGSGMAKRFAVASTDPTNLNSRVLYSKDDLYIIQLR